MKIIYRGGILLFLFTLFFGFSHAGYMGNIFGNMNMFALNDTLWTPKVFDMPDKYYHLSFHSSADTVLNDGTISLDSDFLENIFSRSDTFQIFYKNIRQNLIQKIIGYGFSGFITQPQQSANNVITIDTGILTYTMHGTFNITDSLDMLLKKKLSYYKLYFDDYKKFSAFADFPAISFKKDLLLSLHDVYLFKDDNDLHRLGYEIISRRSRTNYDKKYRRYNIQTAFSNMGNILIINPQQSYAIMPHLHYNANHPDGKKAFMKGYAIIGDKEKLVYAGGLCGVATAISQGILTNIGLKILEKQSHSKRYKSLYTSFINGKLVDIPGLDATVYSNHIDLRFKNIRNYPIIIVMNYDGNKGGLEQVFTLAPKENIGNFSYIGYQKRGKNKCYSRKINGKITTHCYNEVKK